MHRFYKYIYIFLTFYSALLYSGENHKQHIGIILPMEHAALHDIVQGFQDELAQYMPDRNYVLKVCNAQGDLSLQMALLNNLIQNRYDLYVPIGTSTTQMTLNTLKKGRIVSLAANVAADIQKSSIVPITGILDEIPIAKHIQLLKTLFPNLRKFTVIHSGSEKIHDELKELEKAAQYHKVEAQLLMAQNMTELATCVKNIASDSTCLFILKDHLIVSGISLIVRHAILHNIPLIASDEASVSSGAAFALGVREKEIGKAGAQLVYALLQGTSINDLPFRPIETIQLFVNKDVCTKLNIDLDHAREVATLLNCQISIFDKKE